MDAVAEGQMPPLGAGDEEAVGVGEVRRIAVTRGKHEQHRLLRRDDHAADRHGGRGDPHERGHLDRRLVAQELFGRLPDQRGIGPQRGALVGVLQKVQQAIADQMDGRLVSGNQEQRRHRQQLIVGELFSLVPGRDQPVEQAALLRVGGPPGLLALLALDQASQVVVDPRSRLRVQCRIPLVHSEEDIDPTNKFLLFAGHAE